VSRGSPSGRATAAKALRPGAAFLTLLATAIPPAYRASKLDSAIDDYTLLAGEFTNLRDRFRQAALAEMAFCG